MPMMNGSIFSMIFSIIIIGLLIYGVMLLFIKPFEKKGSLAKEDASMKILRERFARGEIDEKEYKERKTVLQNNA